MKIKMNNAIGPQVRARKKYGNILFPVLGLLSLVGGLQAATQFFAHLFNYQLALGGHFNQLYLPWSILEWSSKWYSQFPDAVTRAGGMGMVVSTTGLLFIIAIKIAITNTSKANEYIHGSARWAEKKDIQSAGLLPRRTGKKTTSFRVYVGGWQDKKGRFHYLRHGGPEHILTYAPTRSGKGVGLVIPTLLSWPSSCVITDLKGELWAITAGWRQRHANNKVLRFEPAAEESGVRWNPLDEIRLGTDYEVGDVQNLAAIIVDPKGTGMESHWDKTAYALLVGLILHVLYKAKVDAKAPTATLNAVDRLVSDPNRDIKEVWNDMAAFGHVNGTPHAVVSAAASDMKNRPEEEAGSVLSTLKTHLSLYRDPIVADNTRVSEFRIADLMNHDVPVSLYIVTQPVDKARLRPLVRVLLNMIVRLLADKLEFERVLTTMPWWRKMLTSMGIQQAQKSYLRARKHYKHQLLGMIDEFPSLGKLEILQESLAFMAGYGLKFYLICQDINQLKSREVGYGPDETITSNCHVQNAFAPNRIETAEHLSRLTGQTTVVKEQITTSGRRMAAMMSQVSRNYHEVQRPLLTPDECMRLPGPIKNDSGEIDEPGDMVIYVAGFPAIYGKQPLYFKDPVFSARAAVPPPVHSDKIIVVKQDRKIIL